MISDDKFVLIVMGIAGVLAGVVVIIFSCNMDKRKKLQPPEPPQTLQWQQQTVSTPTYQPRNIDVEIDRLQGKSDTTVKKISAPLRPNAYQAPKKMERHQGKRDDGGFVVMTSPSTSAFRVGCGGGGCSGGGDGGGGCGGS